MREGLRSPADLPVLANWECFLSPAGPRSPAFSAVAACAVSCAPVTIATVIFHSVYYIFQKIIIFIYQVELHLCIIKSIFGMLGQNCSYVTSTTFFHFSLQLNVRSTMRVAFAYMYPCALEPMEIVFIPIFVITNLNIYKRHLYCY